MELDTKQNDKIVVRNNKKIIKQTIDPSYKTE